MTAHSHPVEEAGNQGVGAPQADGLSPTVETVPVSPLRASIPSAEKVGRGTRFWVSIEEASRPATGDCIADHWWSVHPEKGLAFYAQLTGYAASESPSPQCNQSEATARILSGKLYPDCTVQKVPVVFMRHAERAMAALRAQAIDARRAETQGGSVADESAVAKPCAQGDAA